MKLLQDATAGQVNRLFLLLPGSLLRRKSLFRFGLRDGRGLLLLYRLALPSSGHVLDYSFHRGLPPFSSCPLKPFRENRFPVCLSE